MENDLEMTKIRVIFMGKDKPSVIKALEQLLAKNIEITAIVGPTKDKITYGRSSLKETAKKNGIKFVEDIEIYEKLRKGNESNFLKEIDLVISFLYWKKIKSSLIKLPRIGCINFHPAALPDFRGVAGYSIAILEKMSHWGVSAHFIDEDFDTGDIINVKRFKINSNKETAFSLEQKSQEKLLNLFNETINKLLRTKKIPRKKQSKKVGRYISKKYFEKLRKINPGDSKEVINRKIRAFWYPPFSGAYVKIKNQEFTILNDELLKEIGNRYHKD